MRTKGYFSRRRNTGVDTEGDGPGDTGCDGPGDEGDDDNRNSRGESSMSDATFHSTSTGDSSKSDGTRISSSSGVSDADKESSNVNSIETQMAAEGAGVVSYCNLDLTPNCSSVIGSQPSGSVMSSEPTAEPSVISSCHSRINANPAPPFVKMSSGGLVPVPESEEGFSHQSQGSEAPAGRRVKIGRFAQIRSK